MGRRWILVLAALLALVGPGFAQAPDPSCEDDGCLVESGRYRILLPANIPASARIGAILFFHGYGGSAQDVVSDAALASVARRLGAALVAPDGIGRSWSFPGSPASSRDEFAFVAQVLADVTARFPIDPQRIVASGFSQGGSMVWYLACRMPQRFAAFAPIAGAFWQPLPESCALPRPPFIHVHGLADRTIPLAGRSLRQGVRQGDLFKSLAVLAPDGCTAAWENEIRRADPPEGLACRRARGCSSPALLELCIHAGGHVAEAGWVERAWRIAMQPGPAIARPTHETRAITSP
ncbi:alpha/beta fold hydrolase [Bosea sp. (in: a-proteobacteria)]|uniref:alpha/beta hydrolase family esterase n=1 Tax=Bosea sp. (in: a-proteobacteria) TaxID=1871050 RepID=UPI001220DA2C|nr:alpha/beta fold hydrolase [Bosea sp. (in: a-proteobacteria)]TAJ27950.1 MAG: alpha/beta fold hydrolase [Bosea sp. (in: a-proteobacteria)]